MIIILLSETNQIVLKVLGCMPRPLSFIIGLYFLLNVKAQNLRFYGRKKWKTLEIATVSNQLIQLFIYKISINNTILLHI